MKIDGLTAVVTGGASGLGLATVEALAAAGASVGILDKDAAAGAAVAARLGGKVCFAEADITSGASAALALDQLRGQLGGLRALINCAGIGVATPILGPRGPAKLEDLARVINVNLLGTLNCVRLAAAHLAKNEPDADGERGAIINTASAAAFDGQRGQTAYAASKAAIVGMTLPLARDLSEHLIRVVTLAPGPFDTPMTAGLSEELRRSLVSQLLAPGRLGRPSEFAALVIAVLQNPMLNAETIRLDGGIRMQPK